MNADEHARLGAALAQLHDALADVPLPQDVAQDVALATLALERLSRAVTATGHPPEVDDIDPLEAYRRAAATILRTGAPERDDDADRRLAAWLSCYVEHLEQCVALDLHVIRSRAAFAAGLAEGKRRARKGTP